jgi:Uma2 family endonuclease
MANVTTPKMTAEEFFDWCNRPENEDRRFELEDGEVVEMPPPGELHGVVCWLVAQLLGDYVFRRRAGYVCTNDSGIVVRRGPDTVRGPDVMLFLTSKPIDGMSRGYTDGTPELIVEVFSPTDKYSKLNRRIEQYHRRGVRLVWVVFPEDRTVNVYIPNEFPKVLDESDDLTGNGVLPDFACKVADLFALPGDQPPPPPETPP